MTSISNISSKLWILLFFIIILFHLFYSKTKTNLTGNLFKKVMWLQKNNKIKLSLELTLKQNKDMFTFPCLSFYKNYQVKRGDWPVLGARVEVTVTRPETNGSGIHREKFELLDTGSGGKPWKNICSFDICIIRS